MKNILLSMSIVAFLGLVIFFVKSKPFVSPQPPPPPENELCPRVKQGDTKCTANDCTSRIAEVGTKFSTYNDSDGSCTASYDCKEALPTCPNPQAGLPAETAEFKHFQLCYNPSGGLTGQICPSGQACNGDKCGKWTCNPNDGSCSFSEGSKDGYTDEASCKANCRTPCPDSTKLCCRNPNDLSKLVQVNAPINYNCCINNNTGQPANMVCPNPYQGWACDVENNMCLQYDNNYNLTARANPIKIV